MINLVTASWVYVIGYYALNEPNIWKISEEMNRELDKVEDVQVDCVEDAPTAQSQSAPIIEKLAQVMATDKPYLDELLTLAKLAKQVGVPAYLLGKVINRDLSKNFVTYVNEYRVRLAQELLRDPDQAEARVVDIAFNCGFRTKSAFNDSFRKITGTTPSEYRKAGVGRRSSVEISHS